MLVILFAVVLGGTALFYAKERLNRPPEQIACTMEAKLCSDGSYVGRVPPKCEFAKCPGGEPSPTPSSPSPSPIPSPTGGQQIRLREGEREGSLLVQKIYPDYITGLNFIEYPVARGDGLPITLRIGETASNGCTIMLTLTGIKNGIAEFKEKVDNSRPCPICLASNTLISTPNGEINVKDIKAGMKIWSQDKNGKKIESAVLKVSQQKSPATHRVVHLVLKDARELWVSPNHPAANGRSAGSLRAGDIYDDSLVISTELVPYWDSYTYDLLPDSDTGNYWANGILMGSTLK